MILSYRTRSLAIALLTLCSTLHVPHALAQVVVTQYRVTRTEGATNTNPSAFTFPKSAATCNAVSAPTTAGIASWDDEANPGRFCWRDATGSNWANLTPGVRYTFTMAAGDASNSFSPESVAIVVGRPGVPSGFGIRPTFSGVAFNGTVERRFGLGGVDVATLRLDDTADIFHIGALSLTVPGFSIRSGDRAHIEVFRQ